MCMRFLHCTNRLRPRDFLIVGRHHAAGERTDDLFENQQAPALRHPAVHPTAISLVHRQVSVQDVVLMLSIGDLYGGRLIPAAESPDSCGWEAIPLLA